MSLHCPRCQAGVAPGERFCTHCGQALSAQAESARSQSGGSSTPRLKATWPGGSQTWDLHQLPTVLGRNPDVGIRIDFPVVSRQHARVERVPDGLRLVDLGSLNKLIVGGRVVHEVVLREGDTVRIGDGEGNSVALRLVHERQPAPPKTIRLDGTQPQTLIGRDPSATISLNHPQVSWHHARVEQRGNAQILVDLGSTNGTFVNGRLTLREHLLQTGDRVQIGPFRLEYRPGSMLIPRPVKDGTRIDVAQLFKEVRSKDGPKLILQDITLSIEPNELVALVGGSGTGKSTLLTAINGFSPGERRQHQVGGGQPQRVASPGPIFIDGRDLYHEYDAFRPLIGYVPQNDIIHPTLTVEKALDYVARLRLPPDTRRSERQESITKVLGDVNMHKHRTTAVARLSGGQRKRVSTAVELLAQPRILFLDEPTSGLDPGLDKKMMADFRALADDGRTVLVVTHATSNIHHCDHVVFLARGGRLAFFGPPNEALRFYGKTDFADIYTMLDDENDKVVDAWIDRFRRSELYQRYVAARVARARTEPALGGGTRATPKGVGALRQWSILSQRYLSLMTRDWKNLLILLLQAPIIGLILYAVTEAGILDLDDAENAFKAQPILNTMAIVAVWFGVSNAAREITKESQIYLRERMASLKIVPYVLSKVGVLAALCVIQTAVLLWMVLAKTGLPEAEAMWTGSTTLDLYITLLLTSLAGLATGLLLSAVVSNEDRAMSFTPIILVPQMILSGVSFKLSGASEALSRLTLSYWSTHALGSQVDLCRPFLDSACPTERINLDYTHDLAAVQSDWLALAAYALIFLLLTMAFVKRKDVI